MNTPATIAGAQASPDVLIIGAGPAGSTAAALLHKEGFKVLVIESQTFPRFVIGESLLPASMDLLEEAGFLEAVQGQNFMKKFGAVFLDGDRACNFDFSNQFSDGYDYTYQVPRADFDQILAQSVAARGVQILFNHSVVGAGFDQPQPWAIVRGPDGQERTVTAKFILDCSGFGRVLPKLLNLESPSFFPPRESLFTHVRGDHRPAGREEGKIWVCIHPDGAWIWIIPFADGRTSVGVVGEPAFFQKYKGDTAEQFRKILAEEPNAAARLEGMEFLFPPKRISGYACAVKQLWGPGYALVGNATEFLDPIFSSGVTLALDSASCAVKVLVKQLRGETVDWQRDYAELVMHGINTFRAYVVAWYDTTLPQIFFNAQRNPGIMRQVCSVLAGHVWDKTNPYVTQPERALKLLAKIVTAGDSTKSA